MSTFGIQTEAKPYIPHEDAPDPAAPNAGKQAEVKVDGGAGFTINQHASRAHPGARGQDLWCKKFSTDCQLSLSQLVHTKKAIRLST